MTGKNGISVTKPRVGVSGLSLYVPPLRVDLEKWCEWTGNPWGKINKVVGRSFRMPSPDENVYTMTANAALRLIVQNDVDPESIGFLALGTESSKDNSAGAVIVRGMLDRALEKRGLSRLSRHCEVPEFKHACLGGVYGLKGALRYVTTDGSGRKALVVCGDVAEYERGSTGEQTQGAGAVGMLVEEDAKLFHVDLKNAGSASDYRGPDFRKPMSRMFKSGYSEGTTRMHDFPVFSGKYSTFAYIDETVQAMSGMLDKLGVGGKEFYRNIRAIFFHRPYAMMPVQGLAFLYVRALAGAMTDSDEDKAKLAKFCEESGASIDQVLAEGETKPDLYGDLLEGKPLQDPYPHTAMVAGYLRKTDYFKGILGDKMSLGADGAMDLGNLYTAALPAWLASGFEEALDKNDDLAGKKLLAVGYGSGDAAEAIPLTVADEWKEAASRIGFKKAFEGALDLTKEQYEGLHDKHELPDLEVPKSDRFVITHVGEKHEASFQDLGVEYYDYVQ